MSVILDALRRARGDTPSRDEAGGAATGIPAALRISKPRRTQKRDGARWGMLAVLALLAVVTWAAVQFVPGLFVEPEAPVASSTVTPEPPANRPPAQVPEPVPSQATDVRLDTPAPDVTTTALPPPSAPVPAPPRQAVPRRVEAQPPVDPAPVAPVAPVQPPPAVQASVPPPAASQPVDHLTLAVRYHRLGNFEQALAQYNAALMADEFNVEARNNLGLLYHERGLTAEAIDQFKRAIAIRPGYLTARNNLAVALLSAGRLAEARAEIRDALARDPRSVDLLVNKALVEKADGTPDLARETLNRALAYDAASAAAHYNLGLLYDEAGEVGRAYAHYNDFLKYAGSEYGSRLSDVRRRLEILAPRVQP